MDREPNEDSKSLNPSQKDYEQKFDALSRAEAQSSTVNNQDQASDASQLNESESQPSDKQGFYRPTGKSKSKIGIKKRKGPIGLIIGVVIGGGLGFGALFSPALGIVHLKETMVNKMNRQLGSMDARTQRVILSKVDNTTNPLCKIKVKCKFKSMSAKQLAKFEKAGFVIESEDKAFGRKRITSMSFTDSKGTKTTITADNFRKNYRTNSEIRSATHKAYNPKFGGFADKVWTKVKSKFGISERGPKAAATDEERAKNLQDNVKNGMADEDIKTVKAGEEKPCSPECPGENGKVSDDPKQREKDSKYTETEAKDFNESKSKIDTPEAKNIKTSAAISELEDAAGKIGTKGALNSLSNSFKITGAVDNACSIYGAIQAVGYGAKTLRAIQLARYAMAFFTVADMIKAGKAKPEDVAYLGTILTSVAIDASSSLKRKTAFDSYGYRYAAYGDSGKMGNYTMQFLAGGGLTGNLIVVTSLINAKLGKNPRKVCKTLSNPWVMAGSLVAGVGAAIFSGGTFTASQIAISAGIAVSVIAATLLLPKFISDIVAGNVTKDIVGEDAGDAITSGAGSVMGSSANGGGNSVLTKDQALAYNNLQEDTILAYNSEDSRDSNPLDAYNPNSFLGSILGKFYVGFVGKTNLSQYSSSLLSFINGSFASIIPRSMAASDSKMAAALEVCQDYDYREMGIATDPFCNPIFGIPPEYLDADPDTIIDTLISNGYIDENGDYQQKYNTFIESCVNRTEPFGGVKQDNTGTDGSECKIEGSEAQLRAYAYIHQIDNRVEDGMDGYEK